MVKRAEERDVTDDVEEITDLTTAKAISDALARMGVSEGLASINMQCRKILQNDPKGTRVYDGPPEGFDLMNIAREHGEGKYHMMLRGPSPKLEHGGRIIILGSEYETVSLTHAERQALIAREETDDLPLPAAQPQITPADIAAAVAAALAPLLQNRGPDPFEMLIKAKELFAPAPVTVQPVAPVVERSGSDLLQAAMAKRIETMGVFELAEKMGLGSFGGGEGDDGDISVSSLTGLASQFFKTIQTKQSEKQEPALIENPPQQTEPEDDMLALMMVESAAKKNADTDEWADNIAQFAGTAISLGNGQSATLGQIVVASNWFEVLTAKKPTLAQYKPWLSTVRDKFIALMEAEQSEQEKLTPAKDKGKSKKA